MVLLIQAKVTTFMRYLIQAIVKVTDLRRLSFRAIVLVQLINFTGLLIHVLKVFSFNRLLVQATIIKVTKLNFKMFMNQIYEATNFMSLLMVMLHPGIKLPVSSFLPIRLSHSERVIHSSRRHLVISLV